MMKIIPFLTFIAVLGGTWCAMVPAGYGQYEVPEAEYGMPGEDKSSQVSDSDAGLVSLSSSKIRSNLQDLEKRVKNLEQQNRFLDERIRQLDRVVDDLRRRR